MYEQKFKKSPVNVFTIFTNFFYLYAIFKVKKVTDAVNAKKKTFIDVDGKQTPNENHFYVTAWIVNRMERMDLFVKFCVIYFNSTHLHFFMDTFYFS